MAGTQLIRIDAGDGRTLEIRIAMMVIEPPKRADPEESKDRKMSPRMRQTLEGLLCGESEKQIAYRMGISQHTVHFYVKALYKLYGVNSRGELLSRFVAVPA